MWWNYIGHHRPVTDLKRKGNWVIRENTRNDREEISELEKK